MSLYTDRQVVVRAIDKKSPEMFGHRRAFAPDGGPPVLNDPTRPYNPPLDLQVVNPMFSVGFARTANWTFVLKNTNRRVAFRRMLDMMIQGSQRQGRRAPPVHRAHSPARRDAPGRRQRLVRQRRRDRTIATNRRCRRAAADRLGG